MYDCKICGITTMPNNKKFDPDAVQQHIFLYHPGLEDMYGWKKATQLVMRGNIEVTLTAKEFLELKGEPLL